MKSWKASELNRRHKELKPQGAECQGPDDIIGNDDMLSPIKEEEKTKDFFFFFFLEIKTTYQRY